MTARDRLAGALSADLLAALEEYVNERIADALTTVTPKANGDPRWLTVAQAAERLSCSPDAIRMRVKRGRLDHRRQGRRLYVSAASVDDMP